MALDHKTAEQRSLRYHRAIAQRISADPSILARARERVAKWIDDGSVPRHYAVGWKEILSGSDEMIRAFLLDPSEEARAFRQVSPFAGALSPRERWALWSAKDDDDATAA